MKHFISAGILFLVSYLASANDGAYYSSGGNIYPVTETNISINKEFLSFTVRNNICTVNIEFEFYNPDAKAHDLLIGFQAPSPSGDISDDNENNMITGFRIQQNGQLLPYRLKAADCPDCELQDTSKLHFTAMELGIYVYLFSASFQPGINIIQHSYSFPASHNVSFDQIYNYILTTGAKWAGEKINDLTVQFDPGDNSWFYVRDIFGKTADWKITGTGKVTHTKFAYGESDSSVMLHILSGKLLVHVVNFSPMKDIEFGVIDNNSFTNYITDGKLIENGAVCLPDNFELTERYTNEQLKLMRNTIYAQYGYSFSDPTLLKYFQQFSWYLPDPNLKLQDITLTPEESAFIAAIKKLEGQ